MVCTNNFQDGVGGVLMQEGKVISYESWKMKEHEQRDYSYDPELTTIVNALKVWRHYFLGKKFVLMTYHNSLTNFFKKPSLNAQQVGWKTFLGEFDFDIKHLKGKENRVAYALRRKLHHLYEITYS